jgi:hypothetical protein
MNKNPNMEINSNIQEDKKDEEPVVKFMGNRDLLGKHIAMFRKTI